MSRSPRRRRITGRSKVALGALSVLALVAYANAFSAQLIFDNTVIILEDPRLRAATPAHLHEILTHSYWWPYADSALYRPLTTLTYLLNYSVFGNADHPGGYHAVNLLLHIANAWLLFAVVERVTRRFVTALLAAAVWTVHPLLSEAVTNVVGRADLLSAAGVLGGLLCHLHARDGGRQRRWWQSGVIVAAAIAVFSKESGIMLAGVIVLFDLFAPDRRPLRSLIGGWMLPLIPAAVFLALRAQAIGAASAGDFPFVDNPIIGAPWFTGRLTALAVAGRYIALIFWPATLSADYSFPQVPLATGTAADVAAWALLAMLIAGAILLHRRSRAAAWALTAAALLFLPTANLLFPTGTIMAERLMYLPSAAVIVVFVFVMQAYAARFQALRAGAVAAVLLVLALSARTVVRNRDWRDELALWTATVAASPGSFKAHSGLAEAMYAADSTRANLPAVIAEKERSLTLLAGIPRPAETIKPYSQAATYYLERGEWLEQHGGPPDEITRTFARAAELARRYLELLPAARALPNPPSTRDESDVLLILSSAMTRLSDAAGAVDIARRSRAADPFTPMKYRGEASALLTARRNDEAAVTLMTGFMVTGDQTLRGLLIELYRGGLDAQGCAVTTRDGSVTLNTSCPMVRRHICAAATETAGLHRARGRTDLADAALAAVANLGCASPPPR